MCIALPQANEDSEGTDAVKRTQRSSAAQRTVLKFNQLINKQDLRRLTEMMTEDHRLIAGAEAPVVGRDACAHAWTRFVAMFSDYRNELEHVRSRGIEVWIRGRLICRDDQLNGPAAWRAVAAGERVREWQVDVDTPEGWRRLRFNDPNWEDVWPTS